MRQYVGARYVPKLYNVNGSAEWTPNTVYEPLTIVTYNYGSYTSVTTVPATVGNPVENPTFWVATGNYNGFIESTNEKLSDFEKRMNGYDSHLSTIEETLDNEIAKRPRNVLIAYDSLGSGYSKDTPTENQKGWAYYAKNIYTQYNFIEANYLGAGLMGFVSGNAGIENTFLYVLQNAIMPDNITRDDINEIWIVGGTNDRIWVGSQVRDLGWNILNTGNVLRSLYKNAIIKVACFCNPFYGKQVAPEYKAIEKVGGTFIDGSQYLICHRQLLDRPQDYAEGHLSQDGYSFYSPYLINSLIKGNSEFSFGFEQTEFQTTESFVKQPIAYIAVTPNGYEISFQGTNIWWEIQTTENLSDPTAAINIQLPLQNVIFAPNKAWSTSFFIMSGTQVVGTGKFLTSNTTYDNHTVNLELYLVGGASTGNVRIMDIATKCIC